MAETFKHGFAVVIGVGADLAVTIDDATALAQLLQDPTRCAYPTDQVRLLTGSNARRQSILEALDWLASVTTPESTALVYFSGHGREAPDFALIPYGDSIDEQLQSAIAEKDFSQKLRAINAGKLLVLLDCCHAGGQAEAKDLLGAHKSPMPPSLADEFSKSSGRVIIASSRKNEVSYTGNPYSEFTIALLEGLAGYGAFEQDGYARVLDITMWVGRKVPERTEDRQHPIIKVRNLQDNFALAWYANGEKSLRPLSWTANKPTSASTSALSAREVASLQLQLENFRQNYMLIEERISMYVDFVDVPLQLKLNQKRTENRIAELEAKLRTT